ncbi:hypothetical protein C0993_009677 [Termitomyces sp. T159_Od127]|nr:hypothetical protein C0993_009677 [Termitomyces sp. T159_Od127]
MSELWDSLGPSTTQEFFLSVELYLSSAAALVLPKPIPRKRREKPEISASTQPEERKVKEKSSWLTLSKGLPEGPWRPATCKFSGEGERCLLNIYLDKNRLYQTVYIHLINQTDIRQADLSLFNKKDCLSIYCVGGQRWTSNLAAEPIYLHFPSSETCNTWLALLRSFAVPEIHGRLLFPNDGGSHRMWRQLELTVVQGRGLGTVRVLENGSPGDIGESDDFTVSCDTAYASLFQTLNSRNFLDWIDDFENKLKMKNVSQHLMSLAIDRDMVFSHVEELAAREINAASPGQNTLFRGNTTLSRVMELCMNWYGKTFLEASVGGVIRKLCREKVAIEVDPARRSKGSKDIERNFELLTTWCQEFLDQIYAVRTECPQCVPQQ